VPSGLVKWYDVEKKFGFLTSDDGDDVFVHGTSVSSGEVLKPGQRVEFSVADGKRGLQALKVTVLDAPPSVVKAKRKPAEDMAVIIEDVIKLLDDVSNTLRHGKYPNDAHAAKIASVLRAVAGDLDV
jgi:CspA family cold shock protein